MGDCNICVETYNKSTRKKVCCPFCQFETCVKCLKTFLLNLTRLDAYCMNCNHELSGEFIIETTNKTFHNDYRSHLSNIVLEREKSLLPVTQNLAEKRKQNIELEDQKKNIRDEIFELRTKLDSLKNKEYTLTREIERNKNINNNIIEEKTAVFTRACANGDCKGYLSTQWKCGLCNFWTCPHCLVVKTGGRDDPDHKCNDDDVATTKLLKSDTKPCPNCSVPIFKIEGCFSENTPILMWDGSVKMSQNIKIGDILVGDDGEQRVVQSLVDGEDEMYEIVQKNGMNYTVNSQHTLVLLKDSENIIEITIADYLKSDKSSSFNGLRLAANMTEYIKTGVQVLHIGRGKYYGWSVDKNKRFLLEDFTVLRNCDQMFCTCCHVAFSWKTGKIEKGVIHNPHFYSWQREQNGGVAPRNVGDVRCGGIPRMTWTGRTSLLKMKFGDWENCHRLANHINDPRNMDAYNDDINVNTHTELRIRYLLGILDETGWKKSLKASLKKREKNHAVRQVLTMVSTILTDLWIRFDSDPSYNIKNDANQLRDYANDHFQRIEKTFGNITPWIAINWTLLNSKPKNNS
jgi:hypothetical protein